MTAGRPVIAFLTLLVLLAVPAVPVASADASATTTATQSAIGAAPTTIVLRAYFLLRDRAGGDPKLVPVLRRVAFTTGTAAAAVRQLVAGPSAAEASASPRIITVIPGATTLLGVRISAGMATVNLSRAFGSRGTTMSMRGRLAQVVYTLTQFPTISRVSFEIEGTHLTTFSGVNLSSPVTRATFRDAFLPDIFVDRPAWGATIGNPGRVTGLANVFEATFRIRVLDGRRRILLDRQVMATCGTGCWGTFDITLRYTTGTAQWGSLRVYNLSAKDGHVESVREYPVWLTRAP
jgi:germination protein M